MRPEFAYKSKFNVLKLVHQPPYHVTSTMFYEDITMVQLKKTKLNRPTKRKVKQQISFKFSEN